MESDPRKKVAEQELSPSTTSYHVKTRSTFSGSLQWSKQVNKTIKGISSQIMVVGLEPTTTATENGTSLPSRSVTMENIFKKACSPVSHLTLRNKMLLKSKNQRQEHLKLRKKYSSLKASKISWQKDSVLFGYCKLYQKLTLRKLFTKEGSTDFTEFQLKKEVEIPLEVAIGLISDDNMCFGLNFPKEISNDEQDLEFLAQDDAVYQNL